MEGQASRLHRRPILKRRRLFISRPSLTSESHQQQQPVSATRSSFNINYRLPVSRHLPTAATGGGTSEPHVGTGRHLSLVGQARTAGRTTTEARERRFANIFGQDQHIQFFLYQSVSVVL